MEFLGVLEELVAHCRQLGEHYHQLAELEAASWISLAVWLAHLCLLKVISEMVLLLGVVGEQVALENRLHYTPMLFDGVAGGCPLMAYVAALSAAVRLLF